MSIENEDYKSNLGFRLKTARKEANLSQGGLATMTGMARDTISRYERGELVPSAEVLAKILMALDSVSEEPLDANWLLSGAVGVNDSAKSIVVDGVGQLRTINFTNGGSVDISLGAGDLARLLKGCLVAVENQQSQNELVREALHDLIEYLYTTEDGVIELIARAFIANKSVRLTPSKEVLLPLDYSDSKEQSEPKTSGEASTKATQNFHGKVGQVGGGDINNYGDKDK